jgi:hypothetical protein
MPFSHGTDRIELRRLYTLMRLALPSAHLSLVAERPQVLVLGDRLRLVLRLARVYLDHPDLVRPLVGELFDRGFCEKSPSQ